MGPEIELLTLVVAELNRAGIDHMVTGSFASTFHGEPRMTRDIDMVIDPSKAAIEMLVAQFPGPRFYAGDATLAVERRDMFNLIDTESGWKVDLIVRKDRPFSVVEFSRRQPVEIGGVQTFITTVEDAILSKLDWQRDSASTTQRRDVVEMFKAQSDCIDWAYLRNWAIRLGLVELLAEVLGEAGVSS